MSNTGRNLKRENEIRREKTAMARRDKVIIGYIMAKYPSVYKEAHNYTKELERDNPNKIDLTKTAQFRALVKVPEFTDNMELKIELMDEGKQSTSRDLKAATLDGENDLRQDPCEENIQPLSEESSTV